MGVVKLKMKNEFLLFLFLSVFIGIGECGFPELNVPDEWVFSLQANTTRHLEITCTGDRPLNWSTKVDQKYVKYNNRKKGSTYYSTLIIDDPIKDDTGYFNCSYAGDKNGPIASTYVYMYDGISGFVEDYEHPLTVKVAIGDPIELDCRTTRPDIRVSIFKNEREDVTNEFTIDHLRWFNKPAVSLQETGIYSCKEKKFGGEKTFLVNIQPQKKLQKPSIDNHRNSYYVVGEEFALNCSIPVDKKDSPKFEWKYPNPNSKKETMLLEDEIYAISTLKIRNPTLSDSGKYTCIVEQGDSSVSDVKTIQVKESIDPFVQFLVKDDAKQHILFVKEGELFQWVMYFEGYPKNLKYTFIDPYRKTLQYRDKRISTSYVYEDGKLSLNIQKITAEDFGNYSVKLEAPNGSYDENYAILIVNATPKIEFEYIPSLLPVDEDISITATILSFMPSNSRTYPNVSCWYYSDCPEGIGSCDRSNGTLVPNEVDQDKGPVNRYKSVMSLRPDTSGELVCQVKNNLGINDTEIYLNVSDKSAPFLVTVRTENGLLNLTNNRTAKPIKVIEGDSISLECSALDFLYKNLTFNYTVDSHSCDTELSSAWCLDMVNIALNESHTYECIAQNRATEKVERIPFQLSVIEKLAPRVLSTSNVSKEGTTISVKSSDPFSIACNVEGRPTPKITWLKDGVNINEIPDYLENKDRVFLRNNDQILEFKFAQMEYEGKYECRVENRVGSIEPYANVVVEGAALSSFEIGSIVGVVLFIIILISVVFILVIRVKKESKLRKDIRQTQLYLFEKGNVGDLNKECTIDEQAELLPYDRTYEVEKERIRLGKQLGVGAFGRVMLAEVKGLEGRPSTRVAVKMCKDGADMAHLRALTLELKIMIHLGKHLNIVNLIGAHTSNMDKGDLWILVEYCKYGNLLKFIQRAKAQFINQIDPMTGEIDIYRTSPFPNDPLSPTSLGRSSVGFGRALNVDPDGYLESYPGGSIRSGRSIGRHPSTTSNTGSTMGTSRPGLYAGNPHYTTVGFLEEQNSPTSPPPTSGGEHYVTAAQLPTVSAVPRKESSISNSASEMGYHMTLNTEMTTVSSPPPFSPAPSSTSGDMFFDSQGKPVTCDSGGIPGVSSPFATTDLICWAWQVANGMEYLTRRKVLHGDLAARNLLLADNNVVKISDFGLSRDMYKNDIYMKKGDEIMPIKWMAPEAIQQKVFSIQSDVWAYGITLWEMFTLGNTPYPGVPLNQEFTIALENGMRMEKPRYCNEEIYSLMVHCWRLNPVERPSFIRIADLLYDMLCPEKTKNYVEMNTVYMRKNEEWMGRNEDYLNMVTSPDFKNLHSPIREEGISLDPNYIPMTIVSESSLERGSKGGGGYLDMKSVRTGSPESIFSPRPPSPEIEGEKKVFTFNESNIAFSEEQQSPVETSTLLEKPEGSPPGKKSPKMGQTSPIRNHNNNVNKLNGLNQQNHRNGGNDQPMYQNLDKVTTSNTTKGIESGLTLNDDLESKINYANVLAV